MTMKAGKIKTFLDSMPRSSDVFTEDACEKRMQLNEVAEHYKVVGSLAHRALTLLPRKHPKAGTSSTQVHIFTEIASPRKDPAEMSPATPIQPVPFPVRNYILRAQPLVGPRRYYRSRAAERMKEEREEMANEHARWPMSFEEANSTQQLSLKLTPAPAPLAYRQKANRLRV
jgi:hypothetical protein